MSELFWLFGLARQSVHRRDSGAMLLPMIMFSKALCMDVDTNIDVVTRSRGIMHTVVGGC